MLACHADGPGSIPGQGKLFPFLQLLHLATTINNPYVCLSLISRDARTPRNSGTNFKLEENVTGSRYINTLVLPYGTAFIATW